MTQEEKSLLIKDLCARLPYSVQVQDTRCGINGKLHDMLVFPLYKGNDVHDYIATTNFYTDCYYDDIELFKPYLFPLSSMTKEQEKEYNSIIYHNIELHYERYYNVIDVDCLEEFYHKNHFDYRGLIPMGLANDATGLNIY